MQLTHGGTCCTHASLLGTAIPNQVGTATALPACHWPFQPQGAACYTGPAAPDQEKNQEAYVAMHEQAISFVLPELNYRWIACKGEQPTFSDSC